jgi:hypothetical protein
MDSAKLNYFLIFKNIFMKKLLIAMGIFAAILLNSSCTADSPEETNKENLITQSKTPNPGTDVYADGIDDKDPPRP